MSYVDTPEFKAKAAAYREKAEAQRNKAGRAVFDADTAGIADRLDPEAFNEKLASDDDKT